MLCWNAVSRIFLFVGNYNLHFYLKGGDFAEELCHMMQIAGIQPGAVRTWKIQDWVNDPIFDEKYVIDIPVGKK